MNTIKSEKSVGEINAVNAEDFLIRENEIELSSEHRRRLVPDHYGKSELNYLIQIDAEDTRKGSKYVTIFEYLDKPEFRFDESMPESEIGTELCRIIEYMRDRGIEILTFTDPGITALSCFIREEFFHLEVQPYFSKNFPTRFIYEEFHPNDEYLIKRECSRCIREFFNHGFFQGAFKRYKKILTNYPELKAFRNKYESFDEINVEFTTLFIEDENAILEFKYKFVAIHPDQNLISRFSGTGNCKMNKRGDYWMMVELDFGINTGLVL
jgi:hypothetical protein